MDVKEDYVRENFGEGGVVSPDHALEHSMVDGIATFDEVLGGMLNTSRGWRIDQWHWLHGSDAALFRNGSTAIDRSA